MLFIANLYDGSTFDVSSDGSQITITDNSNYQDLTGTATAGGANTITLASDSSSITDYYKGLAIEILDGVGVGQKFNITAYNGSTKVATIETNWSVQPDNTSEYEIGESGHLQSDFSEYREIVITNPDLTTYTYSSVGGGDEIIDTPSDVTLPITTIHDYTEGDGKYLISLYVAPTWDAYASYDIDNYPCVYRSGQLYKAIQSSQNIDPSTDDGTYWEAIDKENLQSKYISTGYATFICDLKQCYVEMIKAAVDVKLTTNVDIFTIKEMKQAIELFLIMENIQGLVNVSDWNSVTNLIEKGKTICDCCS